ncbi:MAG: hypothetical protein DRQ55_04470 [Planctomycetota bacterium]|nr:MAG: hypothetical protein DRQ55_04470 [Planctomycetota bacterium]
MPSPLAPAARAVWGACLVLSLAALGCTSARTHRQSIDSISSSWSQSLEEGQQEEVIESVRALGQQSASNPDSLRSLQALLRQARPRGNISMLVRAESLRAAWRIGSHLPAEPLRADTLSAADFSERTREFEQLTLDPSVDPDSPRLLELARFLGDYRFPPGDEELALDLADLVVSRGLRRNEGPVTLAFLSAAPGAVRHGLVLVTLRLADDPNAAVREQALTSARYMHPGPGLDLVAGALGIERSREVLLMALDSLAALHGQATDDELLSVLQLVPSDAELSIRQRAEQIQELINS